MAHMRYVFFFFFFFFFFLHIFFIKAYVVCSHFNLISSYNICFYIYKEQDESIYMGMKQKLFDSALIRACVVITVNTVNVCLNVFM